MKAITVIKRCTSYGALPLVAALASAPAGAAAWEFNPSVEAGLMFDDNYRLTPAGTEIDVQGPVVDAALEMRTLTQTGEFSFTPRVRATYFPDETDLDTVDYFAHARLAASWSARADEHSRRFRCSRTSSTASNPMREAGGDLGEPDIGDSGVTFVDNRRTRASLRPSMTFDVSQRNELQFGVGYTDVSFDRQVLNAQEDYLRDRPGRGAFESRERDLLAHYAIARRALRHRVAGSDQRLRRRARMESAHGRGYAQLSCARARRTWSCRTVKRRPRGLPAWASSSWRAATNCSLISRATSGRLLLAR